MQISADVSLSVSSAPVTLDPNTAHPKLSVSEDLSSVRLSERQQVPDNPERFDGRWCVLGSDGFSSGRHSWDVEVGGEDWQVGVAKKSISRKGEVDMSLAGGVWSIWQLYGQYAALTSPPTALTVQRKLQRVRVQLDWERGEVSFSDPSDDTSLYTFKHSFNERLFPFFRTLDTVQICPPRLVFNVPRYTHITPLLTDSTSPDTLTSPTCSLIQHPQIHSRHPLLTDSTSPDTLTSSPCSLILS